MPGNPLVQFDEGRVGRTARCRPLSYSTWAIGGLAKHDRPRKAMVCPTGSVPLLLLFQVPQLSRQDPAAERAIIHAHELVPLVAEYQEVFRIDFRDNGAARQLIRLGMARQIPVDQLFEFGAASHGGLG